ncbi:glycosyltransferase family 2 protein [Sulfobacillus sp. hq2]|uniref:glycosyltransferase family 2 protein n=1 Tax=Sulfobacillus TaxID=28033 RepID=UPI001304B94D|nr:glycosyltransferase family 2 protein [Sulfobacillus sp. hq2]
MNLSDVSVIIVNYNGANVLPRAVASILRLEHQPGELIIVDNGSTDDSREFVKGLHEPLIKRVLLPTNHGVAGGRNAGVALASGKILAFLDSDGEATATWLPGSLAMLQNAPRAGAIAPLVLMNNGTTINGAGSVLDSSGHGRDRLWGEPLEPFRQVLEQWRGQPVDYPMGCGMVVRRDGLEPVWPLDDALPKWHDDTEIGLRIRRLGYQVLFNPDATVLHHPGHSDPKDQGERQRLAELARLRLLWKYYPIKVALWQSAYYTLFAVTGSRQRFQNWRDLQTIAVHFWQNAGKIRHVRRKWKIVS